MSKKYNLMPTEKQKKIIEKYFKKFIKIEDVFYKQISEIEKQMSKEAGIEDLELFMSDNEVVGVGNVSRTMELIHRDGDKLTYEEV